MPYDYMQDIFDLLKLNQKQPNMTQLTNPQQPQEPLNGQQIVDTKMAEAIAPRQAPNQFAIQNAIGVMNAKQKYMDAQNIYENPQSTDQDRTKASAVMNFQTSLADTLRNKAQAAGLDTTAYGAGVSLADVQNHLASQQAQDIAEAFNGGAYSMTTDQYYDREFSKAIMSGLSPNRARDLASANARKYQANRVAYLDGLYNSWGRNEAGVTNPIGMQVLGMIAQDNPMLANLYAQVYPTPMNEYNTEKEFAKQILQNDQAVNLLGIEQANALERILAELNANMRYATHQHGLTEESKDANVYRNIKEHAGIKAIDTQEQIKLEDHKALMALEKIRNEYGAYRRIAQSVLPPEELETWDKVYLGLVGKGGQANQATPKDSSDKFMTQYVNMIKATDDRIKEEQSRLIEATDTEGEKYNAQIQAKIQELENQRQWLYDRFQDVAEGTRTIPDFTGNENIDVKVAEMIRDWGSRNGYTDAQIRDVIFKQVKALTRNEKYAKQIAGIGMH